MRATSTLKGYLKGHLIGVFVLLVGLSGCISHPNAINPPEALRDAPPHGLVIHGGAGAGSRASINSQLEASLRDAMQNALETGYRVLDQGGTSLDAVTAAIVILENNPAFNAGRGAVFNAIGSHELDASIMDGKNLNAGAVAGVSTIKNPILLARAVMEHSPHVMLSGSGAEQFAQQHEIESVPSTYYDTPRRREQLDRALAKERASPRSSSSGGAGSGGVDANAAYFGTVGVVALDRHGNLAAGTSTGGMTAKRYGRIGDSPVIGAGTYADNDSCGVSSTGHGEYFIRHVVAYSICARMRFGGKSLVAAADEIIMKELPAAGGSGGVVAMDGEGNIAWPYNTSSMVRGHRSSNSASRVMIFKDN